MREPFEKAREMQKIFERLPEPYFETVKDETKSGRRICFVCGKSGHLKRDCRYFPKHCSDMNRNPAGNRKSVNEYEPVSSLF